MVGHKCNSLLGLLSFGNVVNNYYEMSRYALAIASHDSIGGENAGLALGHLNLIVAGIRPEFIRKSLAVGRIDAFRVLRSIDIEYSFSQYLAFRYFEHYFKRSIDENKLARGRVLHDDRNRNDHVNPDGVCTDGHGSALDHRPCNLVRDHHERGARPRHARRNRHQ